MNFGLTWEKLLLLAVIAGLIIGPERLPRLAESASTFLRKAKEMVSDAKTKLKDEMGEDVPDVDWRKLDPRQYDPRRIIRDALWEEPGNASAAVAAPAAAAAAGAAAAVAPQPVRQQPMVRGAFSAETPPPFDPEAT